MVVYLRRVWSCRYFWLSLVKIDLRSRYRRPVIGIGWSLLHPIAMTTVLCTVFHKLFGMDLREYAPFLLSGLCFWAYFSHVVIHGCQSIRMGETYIRQHPAPIAIYPLRTTLSGGFHFLVGLIVLLPLVWILKGINISTLPYLLCLLPTLALLLLFGWAVGVLAGITNIFFPDLQHICEVGLTILFYLTPIIYTPALLERKGLDWLVTYNPLAAFLELLRAPLLHGHLPSTTAVISSLSMTAVVVGLAVLTLVRKEERLIFYL